MADRHKIDFEVRPDLTYCSNSKRIATIAGVKWWQFILLFVSWIVITAIWNFFVFIVCVFVAGTCLRYLGKKQLKLTSWAIYMREKRTNRRSGLSEHKYRTMLNTQLISEREIRRGK